LIPGKLSLISEYFQIRNYYLRIWVKEDEEKVPKPVPPLAPKVLDAGADTPAIDPKPVPPLANAPNPPPGAGWPKAGAGAFPKVELPNDGVEVCPNAGFMLAAPKGEPAASPEVEPKAGAADPDPKAGAGAGAGDPKLEESPKAPGDPKLGDPKVGPVVVCILLPSLRYFF